MTKESEGQESSLKREKNESDLRVNKRVFLSSWHFPGLKSPGCKLNRKMDLAFKDKN